jgi:carboxypeptidase family protein
LRYGLLTLLFLGSALLVAGCAARRLPNYVFSVTGLVAAEDGSPVEDAEITLELNGAVYEAVLPLKTVGRLTTATGSFAFTYVTHEQGVNYTITVSKDGFETQTVSGSAPPAAYHAIRLKKAENKSGEKSEILSFSLWQGRSTLGDDGNLSRHLQAQHRYLYFRE